MCPASIIVCPPPVVVPFDSAQVASMSTPTFGWWVWPVTILKVKSRISRDALGVVQTSRGSVSTTGSLVFPLHPSIV
jgi:hypothetical protein